MITDHTTMARAAADEIETRLNNENADRQTICEDALRVLRQIAGPPATRLDHAALPKLGTVTAFDGRPASPPAPAAVADSTADWDHLVHATFAAAIRRYQAEATGAARTLAPFPWRVTDPQGLVIGALAHRLAAAKLARYLSARQAGHWSVTDDLGTERESYVNGGQGSDLR